MNGWQVEYNSTLLMLEEYLEMLTISEDMMDIDEILDEEVLNDR